MTGTDDNKRPTLKSLKQDVDETMTGIMEIQDDMKTKMSDVFSRMIRVERTNRASMDRAIEVCAELEARNDELEHKLAEIKADNRRIVSFLGVLTVIGLTIGMIMTLFGLGMI